MQPSTPPSPPSSQHSSCSPSCVHSRSVDPGVPGSSTPSPCSMTTTRPPPQSSRLSWKSASWACTGYVCQYAGLDKHILGLCWVHNHAQSCMCMLETGCAVVCLCVYLTQSIRHLGPVQGTCGTRVRTCAHSRSRFVGVAASSVGTLLHSCATESMSVVAAVVTQHVAFLRPSEDGTSQC